MSSMHNMVSNRRARLAGEASGSLHPVFEPFLGERRCVALIVLVSISFGWLGSIRAETQERPNIFTQSVGNIAPGQEVRIEISYIDVLKYDMGEYEFHFPMVVGPRFIPGPPVSSPGATPPELQGKVSPPVADTTRVPDASRISPPVLKPKVRNGHDISLTLSIDAGVPVQDLEVANHEADVRRDGDRKAVIELSPADSVPNKDFVVRYAVAGQKPEMAVLAHAGRPSRDSVRLGNGYFMLMIQPQEDERLKKSPPREMVFLVDVSGSMRGAKTAKTRQMMQQIRDKPVSAAELELAKQSLINSFVFAFSDTHSIVSRKVRLDFFDYPKGYLETYRENIAAVTIEDVQRVARQYLHPDQLQIVLVGDAKLFSAELDSFGLPVERVEL